MDVSFQVVILCDDGYPEAEKSSSCYNIYKAFGMKDKKKSSHSCNVCGKQFTYFRDVKIHEQVHYGFKKFTCSLCSKVFGRGYHLHRHLANVHKLERSEVKSLIAQDEEMSLEKKAKKKLKKSNRKAKQQADGDSGQISNMSRLRENELSTHDNTEESFEDFKSRYQCSDCNDVFFTAGEIKSHLSFCKKKRTYKCRECGAEFANKTSMTEHKRLHLDWDVHSIQSEMKSKESKVKVQVNGELKTNKTKSKLYGKDIQGSEKNMKTHTRKKGLRCSIGQKSFKRRKKGQKDKNWNEKMSTKLNLNSTKSKIVQCDVCGKWLAENKGSLIKHKLMHSNVKRHKCPICPKRFARSDHLTQHVWHVHKMKRQYSCEECKKKFEVFNDFLRHRKEHKTQKRKRGTKAKAKTEWGAMGVLPKRKKFEENSEPEESNAEYESKTLNCNSSSLEFFKSDDLTEHTECHTKVEEGNST